MVASVDSAEPMTDPEASRAPVRVWDLPTRIGHWLMAGGFALAWLTAESETWRLVHVAAGAIGLGVFAIILGLRKKDKTLCEVLGHTRFSCYFIITFYAMQAGLVPWNWPNMATILIFALPCWLLIYLLGRGFARFVE